MGRLKQLRSDLPRLAPTTPFLEPLASQEPSRLASWAAWYSTARWQRLRWSVLVAASMTCARCTRVEPLTRNLVADHVRPHRGDPALFWDPANLQCLCKRCHDSDKQREESLMRRGGV